MTHGNLLSLFSQYLHFMKFIALPIYRLPLYSHQQKRYLKHYERGFSRHLFPSHVTQAGTTRIHNREPKYWTFSWIYDILNSFPGTQSAHSDGHVGPTVRRTPIIELARLNIGINISSTRVQHKVGSRDEMRWSPYITYRSVSSKGAGRPRLTHHYKGWWNGTKWMRWVEKWWNEICGRGKREIPREKPTQTPFRPPRNPHYYYY